MPEQDVIHKLDHLQHDINDLKRFIQEVLSKIAELEFLIKKIPKS